MEMEPDAPIEEGPLEEELEMEVEEDEVIFALTPAIAVQGVIDYKTNEGRKLYGSATYKLEDELYDCQPDGLYQFLQSLNNRAQEYGWNDEVGGILHIPQDPEDIESETNYMINNYGMISLTTTSMNSRNRTSQKQCAQRKIAL